jgi:hypothetical protein
MTRTGKLWLIPTLALAAMALATAPAAAVTVAEAGKFTLVPLEPLTITNSAISVTCDNVTGSGTATNAGAVTIDTLSFGRCTETNSGTTCAMVGVNNLPDSFTMTHNSTRPHTGDMTSDGTSLPFLGLTIHCGDSLTCTVTTDTTLTAELTNSTGSVRGTLEITSEGVVIGGDTGCGIVSEGSMTVAWAIDQTSGQNNTGTGATLAYTDTTFTITA